MFGAVLVTALISMILYSLTFLIQRLVMPWYHRSARSEVQAMTSPAATFAVSVGAAMR